MHDDDSLPWHSHPGSGLEAGDLEDLEGIEKLSLSSVGIDIGSSTSHLIFSRLTLQREGGHLSDRFRFTDRQIVHQSPILLTPYVSQHQLDANALEKFIGECYHEAGLKPGSVDTGAVILTGEALRKENAQAISEFHAAHAGRFICVSAGPNHESILAAHGSGAVALSEARNASVLNIDIGGGTTKLAIIRGGTICEVGSINVGARLIAFDEMNVLTRIEDAGRTIAESIGLPLALGQSLSRGDMDAIAKAMAAVLFEVLLQSAGLNGLARTLLLTESLMTSLDEVDWITFSGGVSEYVYGRETMGHGDLGPALGLEVRRLLKERGRQDRLVQPSAGIRATVIGAGEYTIQASGTTSYISSRSVLPARSLKALKLDARSPEALTHSMGLELAKFDLASYGPGIALALHVSQADMNYVLLLSLAQAIRDLVADDESLSPIFLVLDADLARSLGRILREELLLSQEVAAIDGIDIEGDLDYLDIWEPIGVSEVVPVTVKSLAFPR